MWFSLMLEPAVWGPHYWFVLHTIALTYPVWPTDTAKKKYYDLVQNLPLFLPLFSKELGDLLDQYPVTPYLDSRDSFCRWVHFIHNKVNGLVGRPEISREQADRAYWTNYTPKEDVQRTQMHRRRNVAMTLVIGGLLVVAVGLAARGEILEL